MSFHTRVIPHMCHSTHVSFHTCGIPHTAIPHTQIQYLVDGRLPEDLSQALVFSAQELERLRRRIHVSGTPCGVMGVCFSPCVCVCVCARAHVCVCVTVCVCCEGVDRGVQVQLYALTACGVRMQSSKQARVYC